MELALYISVLNADICKGTPRTHPCDFKVLRLVVFTVNFFFHKTQQSNKLIIRGFPKTLLIVFLLPGKCTEL